MTNKSVIYNAKVGEITVELILEGYEMEEVKSFFQDNSIFTDRTTQEIHNAQTRSNKQQPINPTKDQITKGLKDKDVFKVKLLEQAPMSLYKDYLEFLKTQQV